MNSIVLLPRQTGKTIGTIAHDLWIFYFGTTYTNISYGNKSLTDAMLNLKRLKDMRDLLPDLF